VIDPNRAGLFSHGERVLFLWPKMTIIFPNGHEDREIVHDNKGPFPYWELVLSPTTTVRTCLVMPRPVSINAWSHGTIDRDCSRGLDRLQLESVVPTGPQCVAVLDTKMRLYYARNESMRLAGEASTLRFQPMRLLQCQWQAGGAAVGLPGFHCLFNMRL